MRRTWIAIAVTALVACGQQPIQQQQQAERRANPVDPDYPIIGEVSDARTRAKAHADLAAAYYELGNMGVALEEVRIALAADPNYAPAYNVQGLVNMELKDTAGAEASFKRALALAPQDADTNHNYGVFLCQSGREEQAIAQFMTALKDPLYRTPSKSWSAAGRCVVRKNPKEAAEFFERALRLDPNNANAMVPYAELEYRRGNLSEAKSLVGRYNKLVEPTAESLWLALRIERKLGDRLAENTYATQLRRRYAGSREYQELVRGNFD